MVAAGDRGGRFAQGAAGPGRRLDCAWWPGGGWRPPRERGYGV